MTYIDRMNAFLAFLQGNRLSPTAQLLFFHLLGLFNSVCWPEVYHVSNKKLLTITQLGSDHTLIAARAELEQAGLIVWTRGHKGKETEYRLCDNLLTAFLTCNNAYNALLTAKNASLIETHTISLDNNQCYADRFIDNESKKKYGTYHWVELTDSEYSKLKNDLGEREAEWCIDYIDELAQTTKNKNKWRDWNLVIRKCSREKWGGKSREQFEKQNSAPSLPPEYIPDYD